MLQCVSETERPMVSGIDPVPDEHLTATSQYSPSAAPTYARFTSTLKAWCPAYSEYAPNIEPTFYIQVSQVHAYDLKQCYRLIIVLLTDFSIV